MKILPEEHAAWAAALEAVRAGMLVAFATDTVYGVACDPYNVAAIERLYTAKVRDRLKAIPLLLGDTSSLFKYVSSLPGSAQVLATRYWPGALTLVVPKAPDLPSELGSETTIAVRLPDRPELQRFLQMCGGALATSSANISGQPDAVTATQAAEYLAEHVAVVVDGGTTAGGVPSTVVNCTVAPAQVLRAGAISADEIFHTLAAMQARDDA